MSQIESIPGEDNRRLYFKLKIQLKASSWEGTEAETTG